MARVNLVKLNKTGIHLFWESNWENLYNFSNKLNKNLIINLIINIFLNNKILYCNFFNSRFFFRKKKFFKFKEFNLKRKKKFIKIKPLLTSKVWLIEYQQWYIISLFIYKYRKKIKKYTYRGYNFLKHYYYYYYLLKSRNLFNNRFDNNFKNLFD